MQNVENKTNHGLGWEIYKIPMKIFYPVSVIFLLVIIFCLCKPLPIRGFPDSSAGKESACNAGDLGSDPGCEDTL